MVNVKGCVCVWGGGGGGGGEGGITFLSSIGMGVRNKILVRLGGG